MATIGALVAELSAETASFHRDLGKATSALNSSAAQMNKAVAGIERGFRQLGTTIVALAGPAAMGAWVKSQIDAGDQLNKLSQKTGIAVEKLSAYQYGAKLSDVDTQNLQQSIVRLAKSMQDSVVSPTSEAARSFAALGIKVLDANGKMRSTDSVLEEIGRKFGAAADGTEKTAAAVSLLGRSGADLIPLLNNLDALTEEARRSGKIMSTGWAQASETFNDEVMRMTDSLGMFLTRADNGPTIVDGLTNALKGVEWVALRVAQRFEVVGTTIGGVAAAGVAVATGEFSRARSIMQMLDHDIDEIRKRGEEARAALWSDQGPQKTATPTGGGAALPRLAFPTAPQKDNTEQFLKSLEQLRIASAKLQTEMLSDEAAKSVARVDLARQEWIQKANLVQMSTAQQKQYLEALDQYQDTLRQSEGMKAAEKEAKDMADAEARYTRMRAQFDVEFAARFEQQEQIAELDEIYRQLGIDRDQAYWDARNKIAEQAAAKTNKQQAFYGMTRAKFDQLTWTGQLSFMTGALQQMSAVGATENKKRFELNKKVAIANAIVSTYQGAAAALTWGPILGPILAAMMVAVGLAQVQQIRSASFSGATSPASVGGGTATPVYEPPGVGNAVYEPNAEAFSGGRGGNRPTINLTIESDSGMIPTEWVRDKLMPRINEAIADGTPLG